MTPTPPSTSSSGHSPDANFRVVRKRNRVPLSCAACRHRKLKCNRTNPCENCIKRGDAAGCSYAMPGSRKKSAASGSGSSPDDMQNRIDRLEGLVLSLMTNGAQSAGPTAAVAAISSSASDLSPLSTREQDISQEDNDMIKEEEEEDSDVDSVSNSFGVLKVDNEKGKSMYIGDSHWHLVLSDIAEVKAYFNNHARELDAQYKKVASSNPATALGGPAFLFGAHTQASEGELRAEIPNKSAVGKLVSRYFNSYDPAVHILHSPTFHNQLEQHFRDPSKTSIVWIALLYAVLCLAMQSYHKIGDEPPEWKGRTLQLASDYRMRTVQCLVISDYTKSVDNTIEALLLYVHGEYTSRWDAEVGIWVIVGMIVRLAMRMGYHRDARFFPGITPYQGEMRRRIWAFLRQSDIMFSFQLALPGMVRAADCDSTLPRNIFDDEFGKECKELPPPRPASEPTPVSYMLAKTQLCFVFGEILEEMNHLSGRQVSYDEVMKKDEKLRQVRIDVPQHLHLRPLEDCLHEPATLLMQRFNIDILYQKSLCVLHRKYLVRARTNPRYAHSRRACVEASMEILKHQATLHRESAVGGRMRAMKWFISSLTMHDFLLAAMIVSLDLHYDHIATAYDRFFWTAEQRDGMYHALEASESIWMETVETSMVAFKATRILRIILEKLRSNKDRGPVNAEPRTTAEAFAAFDDNLQPEHSAAMTLGMLSSGGLTPNTAAMFAGTMPLTPNGTKYANLDLTMSDQNMSTGMTPNFTMGGTGVAPANMGAISPFSQTFGNMGGLDGMMDIPATLDWEVWDQYVQNGNALDPSLQFYPMGMSVDAMAPLSTDGQPQAQSQGQPQGQEQNQNVGDHVRFGNSVFMGANTPGRN